MGKAVTKSISDIDSRMQDTEEGSVRYRILQSAKNFKASWIDLGQSLYSAWKDKLYKEWGYATFDAYTAKEIGIKKITAMKLLRSYYFLEREEPEYLKKERLDERGAKTIPSYESVNVLRLAKDKKKLSGFDYASLKREALDSGKDVNEVRRSLTGLIREREELDPEEARKVRRLGNLKRLLATLKSLKRDLEVSKMLPAAVIKDIAEIIEKIESEIE